MGTPRERRELRAKGQAARRALRPDGAEEKRRKDVERSICKLTPPEEASYIDWLGDAFHLKPGMNKLRFVTTDYHSVELVTARKMVGEAEFARLIRSAAARPERAGLGYSVSGTAKRKP